MDEIRLNEKARRDINSHLREIGALKKELQRAQEAGIPGVEEYIERCENCETKYAALKAKYCPNKS